ncbi:MAG: MFS transporter, partial [Gemmatimonadota bacterium]
AALLLARGAARDAEGTPERRHLAYHRTAERTLLAGGALSALALLPGALAPGFGWLLVLWALVGAGGALIAIPSVGLLAAHTAPAERGRAYAAHFAVTHLVWLATYPAAGYLARAAGTPWTFTAAGTVCGLATLVAAGLRSAHREHPLT